VFGSPFAAGLVWPQTPASCKPREPENQAGEGVWIPLPVLRPIGRLL